MNLIQIDDLNEFHEKIYFSKSMRHIRIILLSQPSKERI